MESQPIDRAQRRKMMDREALAEWAKDKPLSILQLDPADRAVLRIAGELKTISIILIYKFVFI